MSKDFLGSASYDPADNKLRFRPFARLDKDVYQKMRDAGFIWAPKQELFVAPMWTPAREDLLEELAGEIGDEDTSLVERAEQRAERFDTYSEHREQDAERAAKAVRAIADNIPFGQPILIGHHSQRRAERDAKKIQNGMAYASKMWSTSAYWLERAEGAIKAAKYKERTDVRARRVKKLEAERRSYLRDTEKHEGLIKLWNLENLTEHKAEVLAGCEHFSFKDIGKSAYQALVEKVKTVEEVKAASIRVHQAAIAHDARWIKHYDNRLAYEKAMLNEAGYVEPEKPKSLKQTLPLLNYRSTTITYKNIYRDEMITADQVEMTKAEYAAINVDYKATRIVDGTHKVRTAMVNHRLVAVFLTNSKVHEVPAKAEEKKQEPVPQEFTRPQREETEREREAREKRNQARAVEKVEVKAFSADQLFVTPKAVADRMADLAFITMFDMVLEPSAGTGNLVDLCPVIQNVVAVEKDGRLVECLKQRFEKIAVMQADFLEVDLGERFDKIIMNPPFGNADDIKHINHAYGMLRKGGRLVAVCAAGPRQVRAFEKADYVEKLPEGSFLESGTNVNAMIVVLTK